MKRTIQLISFTFMLLIGSYQANANHVGGGIISYKYVGDSKYQFQMHFVRWCDGVLAPNAVALSTNVPGFTNFVLNRVDTLIERDDCGNPLGSSGSVNCAQGEGTEIFLYRSQPIDFSNVPPPPAAGYFFRLDLCCRGTSNNLVGQSGFAVSTFMYPFYIQGVAQLPQQLEDNSPLPLGWPEQLTYTANDTVLRQLAAIDPDGDEIRYHLVAPQMQNNTTATYSQSYSVSGYPFTGALLYNGSFLDSTRGTFLSSRAMISTDVIAVEISSYRCGQRISSAIFEFPRIIAATPTAAIGDMPPQISGYGVDQTGNLYLYPTDTLMAGLSVTDSQANFPNSIRAYVPTAIRFGSLQPTANCTLPPCLVITGNSAANPLPQLPQAILNSGDTLGFGFEAQEAMNIQLLAYVSCNQYITDACLDTIRDFSLPLIIKDGRCAANNRIELPLRVVQMELPHLNTPSIRLLGDNTGHLFWNSPLDSNLVLPGLTTQAASLRVQAKSFRRYEIFRRPLNGPNNYTLVATITDINQTNWLDPLGNASYTMRVVSGCDEFEALPSNVVVSFASSVADRQLAAVKLYPNPTAAEVNIENGEETVELRLLDVQGRQLQNLGKLEKLQKRQFDLSSYPGIVLFGN